MKTVIRGQNYNFCVVVDRIGFYIKALDLTSSRFSFINNLNAILSELDIDIDDAKVSESQWLVTRSEAILFFRQAKKFLSTKSSRDYFERKLDEDRGCGEWENIQN